MAMDSFKYSQIIPILIYLAVFMLTLGTILFGILIMFPMIPIPLVVYVCG